MDKQNLDKEYLKLSNDVTNRFYNYILMRYDQESTKPNSLNTRVSIMLTAATLLAAVTGHLITTFPAGESSLHAALCITLWALSLPTTVIVINLTYFFWGFTYGYPPAEIDVLERLHDLREYFDVNYQQYFSQLGTKEAILSRAAQWALCDKLIVCIRADHDANMKKSAALLNVGRSLAVAFVLTIIAYVLKLIIGEHTEIYHYV